MNEMVSELVRYRGLLAMLAWRDIRVRYKQSIMGVAWAFLMPLVQTLILYSIFTFGAGMRMEDNLYSWEKPYILFVLAGVISWSLFSGGVSMSIESLTRNSRLVTKIYFPREVFPLGSVLASLVDFGVALTVFIPFYAWFWFKGEVHPGAMVLLLPLVLVVQVLLVAGMALILSMANLFFRDVKYIMTVVIQLWFFATNIVWPMHFEKHPSLQWIGTVNPMIPIISAYRSILTENRIVNPGQLAISAVVAVAVFLVGWRFFHKAEFKFAEYI